MLLDIWSSHSPPSPQSQANTNVSKSGILLLVTQINYVDARTDPQIYTEKQRLEDH
jgi:hypothetical protein